MNHRNLPEKVRTFVLILAAGFGIGVSVLDLIGHPLSWVKEIPSITLILAGLIVIDLCLERFTSMRRIETKVDSLSPAFNAMKDALVEIKSGLGSIEFAKELSDLPRDKRELVKKSANHYVAIQRLKEKSKKSNIAFCRMADEILDEHVSLLSSLAIGKLNVPNEQIPNAHGKMAMYYKDRLDAVSETDLDFWSDRSSIAEEYFKRNARAVRDRTIVTRIFIFSIPDLTDRSQEVIEVLKRHYVAGIGWGVAVLEELEFDVAHSNVPLDFALYNRGQAVSFFRKKEVGRFEAVFLPHAGHENEVRINSQKEAYKKLIVECWLANSLFKEQYAGALTSEELAEVKDKTGRYNNILNNLLGAGTVEDDTFVLLASSVGDVGSKVRQLADLVLRYRKVYGFKHVPNIASVNP